MDIEFTANFKVSVVKGKIVIPLLKDEWRIENIDNDIMLLIKEDKCS